MLRTLGCLQYSPPLESHIRQRKQIESGHPWELELRGCSIWAVELVRILIDFFLYDTMKEKEAAKGTDTIPHHRTRSIWY